MNSVLTILLVKGGLLYDPERANNVINIIIVEFVSSHEFVNFLSPNSQLIKWAHVTVSAIKCYMILSTAEPNQWLKPSWKIIISVRKPFAMFVIYLTQSE